MQRSPAATTITTAAPESENLMRHHHMQQQQQQPPIIKQQQHPHQYHYQQQQYQAASLNGGGGSGRSRQNNNNSAAAADALLNKLDQVRLLTRFDRRYRYRHILGTGSRHSFMKELFLKKCHHEVAPPDFALCPVNSLKRKAVAAKTSPTTKKTKPAKNYAITVIS